MLNIALLIHFNNFTLWKMFVNIIYCYNFVECKNNTFKTYISLSAYKVANILNVL